MWKKIALLNIAIAIVISCLIGEAAAISIKEYAVIINLAGRQRMLTQKMSKEMFMIAKGVDADANRENLKKTAALFDTTLKGLINGDSSTGLPATTNATTLKTMQKVQGMWVDFKGIVDGVTAGGDVPIDQVASTNLPLLKTMNTAVRLYEKSAKKDVGMASGVVINLAGKQRMLTQKMSKEVVLVALGHNAGENKSNLKNTASLFDKTLTGLKNGDTDLGLPSTTDAAIVAQLDTVASLWVALKPIIARITDIDATGVTEADLAGVAQANIPLLKEMNKAVKMYEKAQ